jgi:hypothetical protein
MNVLMSLSLPNQTGFPLSAERPRRSPLRRLEDLAAVSAAVLGAVRLGDPRYHRTHNRQRQRST